MRKLPLDVEAQIVAYSMLLLATAIAQSADTVDIGSRLEPLVDEYLIDRMSGDVTLQLQKPQPRDVVLVTDKPWEGNTCAYYTIFQDGNLFRMYYRGSHYDESTRKAAHREVTCYAESRDGVHWTRPELRLFEFDGSRQNNIVWDGVGTHCFTPFKDANPECAADAKYKAIGRGRPTHAKGLYALQSPDGLHWKLMSPEPVITQGDFDSQNLAFWNPASKVYVDYHRKGRDGVRDIMTCTSKDFLHWSEPAFLEYPDSPKEHLYTNAIRPYDRAPHILLGFPTRFQPETQQVEPTFMVSRDGLTFSRWTEALIPITAPKDRDANRSNYMTWGLVRLPGDENQLSMYATEAYYTGEDSRVRRFTLRVDGFVSAHASADGGQLLTKPLTFSGQKLIVNFATFGQGSLRVELLDANGQIIDGFGIAHCDRLQGDSIEQIVSWQNDGDLGRLAGRPVRLRFEMVDADLYSFQFLTGP